MNFKKLKYKMFWWELWWSIRDYFNPRQKWLFKKIGNSWKDKDQIIRETLFECLIHFVEEEKGLNGIWCEEYYGEANLSEKYIEERKKVRDVLEYCYNYVKNERSIMEKGLDGSYPESDVDMVEMMENGMYRMKSCEERYGCSYEEAYENVHYWENRIKNEDTFVMEEIIKYREYLWT